MSFLDDFKDIVGTIGDVVEIGTDVVDIFGGGGGGGGGGNAGAQQPAGNGNGVPFVAGQTDRETLLKISGRPNTLAVAADHPVLDVLTSSQPEDAAFANALHQKGVVLANSDAGALLLDRGHKPKKVSVKLSDGRTVRVMAFPVTGKKKRSVNYAAPAKVRDAARTMRAVMRKDRTLDKLAREGRKLANKRFPKRKTACCPPKRTTKKKC